MMIPFSKRLERSVSERVDLPNIPEGELTLLVCMRAGERIRDKISDRGAGKQVYRGIKRMTPNREDGAAGHTKMSFDTPNRTKYGRATGQTCTPSLILINPPAPNRHL